MTGASVNVQDTSIHRKVIILGAGISGLWAAHSLLSMNPGLNVTLLEKNREPGGLFNSSDRCGFHFNHGLFLFPADSPLIAMQPHRFHPVSVSYDKLIDNRLMRFPLDPSEMRAIARISQIPPLLHNRLRYHLSKVTGFAPSNLDEWLHLNLPDSWSRLFRIPDYIYKLMGYESSELSEEVGKQRLEYIVRMLKPANISRHLVRRYRIKKHKGIPASSIVGHQTLNREGTGGFMKELAERIRTRNGRILTDVVIRQIETSENGFRIHTDGDDPMNADVVISTIPVVELARYRMSGFHPPDRLKWRYIGLFFFRLKRSMPEHSIRVIYSFDRSHCWKRIVMRRIDDRFTAIRAEITSDHPTSPDADNLVQSIRNDCSAFLGITDPNDWVEWDTLDVPYGYPCLLDGYKQDFQDLSQKILEPGLYSLSRQGEHRYATSSICAHRVEADVAAIAARHGLTGNQDLRW